MASIGRVIDAPEASSANRPEGFSLLEMMMVITVILIVASISAPIYTTAVVRAREAVLADHLFTLRALIDRFTSPLRACRVDRSSDGGHDQDERDYHHHHEQRETLGAIGAARLGPVYETTDSCDFHSDPRQGAYITTKSAATYAPPANVCPTRDAG